MREKERERARCGVERVILLLAYVRYACASVDQVEEGARGRKGSRAVGWFRRLADGDGCRRGGSSCRGRGCADGCGGCRRERGRRASPAASGRQPFCGTATSSGSLLFPPSPAPSHPPSGPGVSLHALVVSVALPHSSGTTSSKWRVLFSPRPLPRVPSFRSARLNTLLRRYPPCFDPSSYPSSSVHSHGFRGREILPSTIAHACTLGSLSLSLYPSLSFFLLG